MTSYNHLRGVLPVFQTPFDDNDDVAFSELAREIDWIFQCGADGVVMGMVSETLRLSDAERTAVGRAVCDIARGRGPVVLSVGAESTAAAVQLARAAEALGATALMAMPPTTCAPPDDEVEHYFAAILKAVDVPVVVQDASGYVGRPLSIAVQSRLFDRFGPRVHFKPEAPPVGHAIGALMKHSDGKAVVLEGLGGLALVEGFRRGVVGSMPGADLCWAIVELWDALCRTDQERAYQLGANLSSLLAMAVSLDAYVVIEKHLLVRQKVLSSARCRGPLSYLPDNDTLAEIDRLFDNLCQASSGHRPCQAS